MYVQKHNKSNFRSNHRLKNIKSVLKINVHQCLCIWISVFIFVHCSQPKFIVMIVTIPSCEEHAGIHISSYKISNLCPICGSKRGNPFGTHSFDGSRRMNVDGWKNPCGHIDSYSSVRKEGKKVKFRQPRKYAKSIR